MKSITRNIDVALMNRPNIATSALTKRRAPCSSYIRSLQSASCACCCVHCCTQRRYASIGERSKKDNGIKYENRQISTKKIGPCLLLLKIKMKNRLKQCEITSSLVRIVRLRPTCGKATTHVTVRHPNQTRPPNSRPRHPESGA